MKPTNQLGKAIRHVRQLNKKTIQELADAIDSDPGNVSRMERNEQEITTPNLQSIARYLSTTPAKLWALAEQFDKGEFNGIQEPVAQYGGIDNVVPLYQGYQRYPLISWETASKWSSVDNTKLKNDLSYPCPVECSDKTFVLRVQGISMEPKFRENELIFVDPNKPPSNNSFVIIKTPGSPQAQFRQLIIEGGQQYLKPSNPNWPAPILEKTDDIEICGVVIFKGEPV